jgi:hypothetical protein
VLSRFRRGPHRLVRQFVRVLIFGFEFGVLRVQRFDGRLLLGREVGGRAFELPQLVGVAIWEIDIDLDPLPAFGGDLLGFGLQLRGRQAVEQRDIFQPATIVFLEKVGQDVPPACS